MRFEHVVLETFGYALPPEVVTSDELEQKLAPIYERFHLNVGRLELMTGIRQRRFWPPGTLPSQAATKAGENALKSAHLTGADIQCLLNGSVSRDFLEPATASVVHQNLNISTEAVAFDISNACLGFVNGIISLANMIELGQVERGMIVAGENSRQLVETTIRSLLADEGLTRQDLKFALPSLTIGSGAVALIMARDSVSASRHRLVGGVVGSDTRQVHLCQGSADTGFSTDAQMVMHTDAETLLVHGCELAAKTWQRFKAELGWSEDSVARSFTHQVGVAHRDRMYDMIGLDPAKDFATLATLGNVGSVSLPITMAIGVEEQVPSPGDRLAMLGIGSGLNCVMLGVEW